MTLPTKQQLRLESRTRREAAAQRDLLAAQEVCRLFLDAFGDLPPGSFVGGTQPIRQELDPRPLMAALAERGHALCLPITGAKGTPMTFAAYQPGDALEASLWGINTPLPSGRRIVKPDVLLCPLLAFDRQGGRLGYGGGYYDATLAALRAEQPVQAIGLAYAAQEVPQVPMTERDARLNAVVTEREVLRF